MNLKTILPALALSIAFGLTACQGPPDGTQTAPATNPASVPAVTLPSSVPAASQPAPTTTPSASIPSAETGTARFVLQQSAEAMMRAQSYEYTMESMTNFGDSEVTSQTQATVFPHEGDGMSRTRQEEDETVTYLKQNRMYLKEPASGDWVYVDMPQPAAPTPVTIHPRVNEYMTLEKTPDGGYVLSSERPLSALEFYSLTGMEVKEAQTLKDMEAQGQTMETMAVIVLDGAFRYQEVSYEQVTESGGLSTHTILSYTYSNYDAAQKVVVPTEILQTAVPLDPASVP